MTSERKAKFDAILTMEATDDQRMAAFVKLQQEDWDEASEKYKGVKIRAKDGSLHDFVMWPRPQDYKVA